MNRSSTDFIPSNESKWFISIFDLYVRNLFWRRFKNIAIDQQYQPGEDSKTIYYLNHTSWWDGLIPFLLNQKLFKQNARAIMEDKQMRQHKFFSKIGAFSVNLSEPRAALKSLRYAVDSMKRDNSSLFIYPEGKIVPFSTLKPEFQKGLGWIASRTPGSDIVPIGIYIHTARHDKPELNIKIGPPVTFNSDTPSEDLSIQFEKNMQQVLIDLQKKAHSNPGQFTAI
ncbi:lysophospholipid acyltransferase family protein [Rhodohalobacter sp.]|uniref:lysophospholipid acyltransferase family protein n=1 Tax=Rhodohalobacter sp. TaxID=1974210 RepID=UPI003561CDCA